MRVINKNSLIQKNNIYQIDCLEGMKLISDKAIDMILCDLPYGTTSCSWDEIIPFKPLWEQYERIIKDDGAIVLTASQPFTTKLINSNINLFREEVIWLKNRAGSGLGAKQRHIKTHENICVFSKKGKYTYNPQKWEVTDKEFLTQRKTMSIYKIGNNIYNEMEHKRKKDDGTRFPISVVPFKVPTTPSKNKNYSQSIDLRIHPTQKPLPLFEYLIRTYSNEGDTVLDNCMGSGTTAVACENLNRNWIGFETESKFIEAANNRLRVLKGKG